MSFGIRATRSGRESAYSDSKAEGDAGVSLSARETVVQIFEARAWATPDLAAVEFHNSHWTYRELNQQANALAHLLRSFDVVPDMPVGSRLDWSFEMAAAVLGVPKTGGAYVRLDPAYPRQLLAYMVGDTQAGVELDPEGIAGPATAGPVCIDIDVDRIAEHPTDDPRPAAPIKRLAYVTYTSGATGHVKGIAIQYPALVNSIRWQVNNSLLTAGDLTLQFASLSFDVSFQEMLSTRCSVATLPLTPEEMQRNPTKLVVLLRDGARRAGIRPAASVLTANRGMPQFLPRRQHPGFSNGQYTHLNSNCELNERL